MMVLIKVELVINLSSHAQRKRLMRGDDEAYCWPKCFWPLCFPGKKNLAMAALRLK